MGLQFINENQTYLPTHNIDVDFIQLQDSPEYAEYEELMSCDLCDSVRVIFPRYNVDGWFKIVKVTYDVLLERYTEMELGTLPLTLAQALGIK
jgi:phage-related protein